MNKVTTKSNIDIQSFENGAQITLLNGYSTLPVTLSELKTLMVDVGKALDEITRLQRNSQKIKGVR